MGNDDPLYVPGYRTALCVPRPEPVWELFGNNDIWTCELRYQGEWGVEAQIFHDGDFASAGTSRRGP